MAWADYFWPGTDVLRNKLGIRDAAALQRAEHQLTAARRVEIELGSAPIEETYDAAHLCRLHRWLVQDLYDWGGLYRDVEIAKLTTFARVDQIEPCLSRATDIIADTRWESVDDTEFAQRSAQVFGWMNWAHPFRDVNGRSARAFMSVIARRAGRYLDYSAVSRGVWVQRAAFSVPDLDQHEPQYHWLVGVFAAIARPRDHPGLQLPFPQTARDRPGGSYDLGK